MEKQASGRQREEEGERGLYISWPDEALRVN